jgi:CHAT domain-containing protein
VSLEWAEAEAEAIVDLARRAGRSASKALLTVDATKHAVTGLLQEVKIKHPGAWVGIASHGHADPTDPGKSYMLLGGYDTEQRPEVLTLTELQRGRLLQGVRCFDASGCTTAVIDLTTAPDELSSFAAGVLQAGAAGAIATQWAVDDRATFLLMLHFTQLALGDPKLSPSEALCAAARWLRTSTWKDFEQLASQKMRRIRPIRPSQSDRLDKARGVVGEAATRDTRFSADVALEALSLSAPVSANVDHPFRHPIYWACAVVYGG